MLSSLSVSDAANGISPGGDAVGRVWGKSLNLKDSAKPGDKCKTSTADGAGRTDSRDRAGRLGKLETGNKTKLKELLNYSSISSGDGATAAANSRHHLMGIIYYTINRSRQKRE